ncbi:divalent-cation tolerance protein CutA [Streptomyces sp. NPDC055055]
MSDYMQVSTATPTEDQAVALAGSAVKARLAAGAQVIGPVTSVFWHLGEYGTGQEYKVLLSTTTERYPELEAHLLAEHPWDTPELIAVPITAGSAGALDWIRKSVSPQQD